MTDADFAALYDEFTDTAFRMECRQQYAVSAEDAFARAFREGTPRPERSVRTSPWLQRIARTTVNDGKDWSRVRVVEWPLTEYTRHELLAFVESQAVGEKILLADSEDVDYRGPDFWLFDAGTGHARAGILHLDGTGAVGAREVVTDVDHIAELVAVRDQAVARAVPLNVFLAQTADRSRA